MPRVRILLTPGLRSGFHHLGFREQQVVTVDHETCDALRAKKLCEVLDLEADPKRRAGRPKGSKNKPKTETPDTGEAKE